MNVNMHIYIRKRLCTNEKMNERTKIEPDLERSRNALIARTGYQVPWYGPCVYDDTYELQFCYALKNKWLKMQI